MREPDVVRDLRIKLGKTRIELVGEMGAVGGDGDGEAAVLVGGAHGWGVAAAGGEAYLLVKLVRW